MKKTSQLSPDERNWIEHFLADKEWFRFYYECSLADLNEGLDNRSYAIHPDGPGLAMAIHFDSVSIYSLIGRLSDEILRSPLRRKERAELHLEGAHLQIYDDCGSRIRRHDKICYYKLRADGCRSTEEQSHPITRGDFEEVRSFFHEYNPETVLSEWMLDLPFECVREEGRIVATAGTLVRHKSSCHIGNFLTDPRMRGLGLGEQVGRQLLFRLTQLGVDCFYLGVFDSNPAAKRLYEKMGFVRVESRPLIYLNELA